MLEYNLNLSLYLFLMTCLMFSYLFKHLLLTLISLEFMMLNIMNNIYLSTLQTHMNLFFMSLFLTVMICESILGLSILIYLIRNNGNDYLKSLNLMKW
nr:NADH dehydrogenase subunit 4L [Meteorus sp. 2 XHS-2023a]